jgi:tRNA 2-thiouridine synthesizing protein B
MLHIINRSPFQYTTLQSCLEYAQSGDVIVLIEDGVLGAVKGSLFSDRLLKALQHLSIYVLEADLIARGLKENCLPGIHCINYEGFVDLTAFHSPIQTWS